MIVSLSQWLAVLIGVWLIGLSLFMLLAPQRALGVLAAMGGTPLTHFGEMAGRIAAGFVLMLASVVSRSPQIINLIGVFLIVSAVVLMVLPRRWHAAYSTWWATRIPVWAVRLSAVVSIIAGGVLIWALTPAL
ncbi:MAG: hypothetical protein V4707_13825 [Pseudomonadota bacterium]